MIFEKLNKDIIKTAQAKIALNPQFDMDAIRASSSPATRSQLNQQLFSEDGSDLEMDYDLLSQLAAEKAVQDAHQRLELESGLPDLLAGTAGPTMGADDAAHDEVRQSLQGKADLKKSTKGDQVANEIASAEADKDSADLDHDQLAKALGLTAGAGLGSAALIKLLRGLKGKGKVTPPV